jgi:hypothetical protein
MPGFEPPIYSVGDAGLGVPVMRLVTPTPHGPHAWELAVNALQVRCAALEAATETLRQRVIVLEQPWYRRWLQILRTWWNA